MLSRSRGSVHSIQRFLDVAPSPFHHALRLFTIIYKSSGEASLLCISNKGETEGKKRNNAVSFFSFIHLCLHWASVGRRFPPTPPISSARSFGTAFLICRENKRELLEERRERNRKTKERLPPSLSSIKDLFQGLFIVRS